MKVVVLVLVFIFFVSCNDFYKVGNLESLGYPAHTPLRDSLVKRYFDSLILKHGYAVPQKWKYYDKLVDLDSINFKRIYFKNNPEEMYIISFIGGVISIEDVYNPQIREGGFVADRKLVLKEEEQRIRKRFHTEILDTIEAMAKREGLPDSLIYNR